ncbi:7333_t:CDS:1, partial [Funneliformis mosseae]
AYTALSRCPSWDHIQIMALDEAAFMVDRDVIIEYDRLEALATTPLPI